LIHLLLCLLNDELHLVQDALLILLRLTAYPEIIQILAISSLCGPLTRHLLCGIPELENIVITIIGNITSVSDSFGTSLIQHGFFNSALEIFPSSRNLRELCWALSNLVVCGEYAIIEIVRVGLLERILELTTVNDISIVIEAVWVLLNTMIAATEKQLDALIRGGIIGNLTELLKTGNANLQYIILDGLNKVLNKFKCWKNPWEFKEIVIEFIGDHNAYIFEELIMSSNEIVSNLAYIIMANLYHEESPINFFDN